MKAPTQTAFSSPQAASTRRPEPRPAEPRHGLLAPVVVNVFQRLDIGLSLWQRGQWSDIYEKPYVRNVLGFELEHGGEMDRVAYNRDCIERAARTRQTVIGQRWGLSDLFVPVCFEGPVSTLLISGPFQTSRPSSADIQERWRVLTGNQGDLSDPEFAYFLSASLATLVLEGPQVGHFSKLLELLARLCSGQGDADACFAQISALYSELSGARIADQMWEAARAMLDERTSRAWATTRARARRLQALGVARFPEHVAVGLFVAPNEASDALDELLRREAFQRACVELACKTDDVVSGQVGGYGVTWLCASQGSAQRTRRYLLELCEQAVTLARRRFGLELHLGLCTLRASLAKQYQAALAAAESGLSRGVRIVHATGDPPASDPLGSFRRELARLVDEEPDALPARFERYLESVAIRTGYRLDPARVHLEAAFERIAEAFRESGNLELRSFSALYAGLERAADRAGSLTELFAAYRHAVGDIVNVVSQPVTARRDHSLRRAEEYLRTHYQEPVTLERVARVAGFAPSYFSELFHKKQGVTFERYLTTLRLERAKQLLSGTALSLQRVAQLCGFST
ncbi:MAG TPA: AraC family transcriptional regulator, partial [Polyangiaceae bacterium]|nr:AraC family transcriptional regulator [Polyangiaceae bacterium]